MQFLLLCQRQGLFVNKTTEKQKKALLENFGQRVLDFGDVIHCRRLSWIYTGRALLIFQKCSGNTKYQQKR